MKIKISLFAMALALATLARGATNDLTGLLQKGLFEEEANRDLTAAIANYQSLANAFDKDRQLAATAVFRLGECYRKLGNTNEAAAQYQRIIKEFSDQQTLVTLSRQNLVGLNVASMPSASGANESSLLDAQANVASLQAQIEEIKKMPGDQERIYVEQNFPNPVLTTLAQELNLAQQNLIKLKSDYTPDHPKYKNAQELVEDLNQKIAAQIDGVLLGLQSKLSVVQAQLNSLRQRQDETVGTEGSEGSDVLLRLQIERAREQIAVDEKQIQEFLKIYLPENTRVRDLQRKIDSEKAALAQLSARAAGASATTGNAELSSLQSQYALLKAELEQAQKQTNNEIVAELFNDNKELADKLRMELSMISAYEAVVDQAQAKGPVAVAGAEGNLKNVLARVETARQQLLNFQEIRLKALEEAIKEAQSGGVRQRTTDSGITSTTDEEQQEIRRIQLMIQNSPDLINADNGGNSPLTMAASRGQLVVAKYLLDHGANVNGGKSGHSGEVPLSAAAESGQKAMVELLLAHGADVDGGGRSPLYDAVQKGYTAVVEVLLAHHADVNLPTGTYSGGLRPIQIAARDGRMEMLKMLIEHGADLNVADVGGQTALDFAAEENGTNTAKLLLAAKASIEARDKNGNTPLHEAADRGFTAMVSLLLDFGATVDATNKDNATPLLLAISQSRVEVVRLLLQHKADPNRGGILTIPSGNRSGWQPVFLAIEKGQNDILELLLDAGANAETNSPIFSAIEKNNVGAVQLLLDHGVNPNVSQNNVSALNTAIQSRRKEIVAALLDKGADPNAKDFFGRSPLFWSQTLEIARLLIEHKADVNVQTREGGTPLMNATDTNIVGLLLESGAKVDVQETNGNTALHVAVAFRASPEMVAILLAYKANPNIQNEAGNTPLDLAKVGFSGQILRSYVSAKNDGGAPSQVSGENEHKISELLVNAGGLANLPKRNRIEVRRASNSGVAFTKGSHDWSRYSLLEIIAGEYHLLNQDNSGDWLVNRGPQSSLLNDGFPFPDFKNVTVYRRTDASAKQKTININVEDILNSGERSRDVWLEWGDVVEIPETDHPVDQIWGGLTDQTVTALTNSVAREVTVVIKGARTPLKLFPKLEPPRDAGGSQFVLWRASFMLCSVLDHSKLVRVSSDLSRVKVTRVDPETKKKQEWIIDCTNPTQADLWLRDGDVIDVPEK